MLGFRLLALALATTAVLGAAGIAGAWLMRRRTMLSIRNVYAVAVLLAVAVTVTAAAQAWNVLLVLLPVTAPAITAAVAGRRWRLSDLGAGEELRRHELSRRWVWQPRHPREDGERVYIRSQGEIMHERPWPKAVEYVPMTAAGDQGPRLPLGEGMHIFEFGGTGTGKTTTALRVLTARTLSHRAAALLIDQKGDPEDEQALRRLAAAAHRSFVLFDPRSDDTDRWQPLWGAPADVAARAVESIKKSEPYYADVLRQHLNVIVDVLHAAGTWPPSFPLLVDAARPARYTTIIKIVEQLPDAHDELKVRVKEHGEWVRSREGRKDLAGGLVRLELVMGSAWRQVLTPRATPTGEIVAVNLIDAIRQGAIVMWRTYADDMPDEAAAITVLALADLHAAAGQAGASWTLMLDEFGAVIEMAAARGTAILQRARSHHGQVIVITQSAADIEALSQQPGLLSSLADNFAAFVAHRQTAPDTRDWIAKLMGTSSLWQSTDQTQGHGAHSGKGSRRRVREFRVSPDEIATLRRGEAILYTTLGPPPITVNILAARLPAAQPTRVGVEQRHPTEMHVNGGRPESVGSSDNKPAPPAGADTESVTHVESSPPAEARVSSTDQEEEQLVLAESGEDQPQATDRPQSRSKPDVSRL